jgi:hypothetical protein
MKKGFYIIATVLMLFFSCIQEEASNPILPEIGFGVSKAVVLSNEQNILEKENDSVLTYYSEKTNQQISYAFKNDSLVAISIVFDEKADSKHIKRILDNVYIPITPEYRSYYYCTPDRKRIVILSENDVFGLNILFVPYDFNDNNSDNKHTLQSIYISGIEKFY